MLTRPAPESLCLESGFEGGGFVIDGLFLQHLSVVTSSLEAGAVEEFSVTVSSCVTMGQSSRQARREWEQG